MAFTFMMSISNKKPIKPILMKHNSTSSLGALHPILFFLVVYGISLFLALFVCRTVYYGINNENVSRSAEKQALIDPNLTAAVAYK